MAQGIELSDQSELYDDDVLSNLSDNIQNYFKEAEGKNNKSEKAPKKKKKNEYRPQFHPGMSQQINNKNGRRPSTAKGTNDLQKQVTNSNMSSENINVKLKGNKRS